MPDIDIANMEFYTLWQYCQMIFLENTAIRKKYENGILNGIHIKMNIEMLRQEVASKPKKGLVRIAGRGWWKIENLAIEKQARTEQMLKLIMEAEEKGIKTTR